jgi:dTDP-glucose 4,6-dehydratase
MSAPVKPLPIEDLDHVLAHTRSLWTEARGQSFFITGGTGFFGMWLLESFARANDELALGMRAVVLTRNPESFAKKAPHLATRSDMEFIRGDVRSFIFPAGRFAYLVHAATEASVKLNAEAPQEMLDVIVGGTRRVLDFAAQAGVKKLLLTSSGAVYGKQPSELTHIPEDYSIAPDPTASASAYAEGKRISEDLCARHARQFGTEVKIARCFAFVGPHLPLDAHFAIGNFIRDAMHGGPIRVKGDGTPYRSYLYAADLAIWLWTLLFRAPSCRAYNVGSDADLTISALAHTVASVFAARKEIVIERPPNPMTPSDRYSPDLRRINNELGLRVEIDLRVALSKTFRWLSADSKEQPLLQSRETDCSLHRSGIPPP